MYVVMPNGDWEVDPGEIVVSALLADLWPPEYEQDVMKMVRMSAISIDPGIFGIMEKLEKWQVIVERRTA